MENERIKALEEELRSLENRKCEIKQQICEEKASSVQKNYLLTISQKS